MNKELCFQIENKDLYLEQVLVEYMDVPIFFLCKDDKQFYIVMCTDIDNLKYVVEKLSPLDVYNLLHGKISMRNVFLTHKEYWEIISGEEISSDKVTKQTVDRIDHSILPEENACFEVLTEEIRSYVEKFDNEFFSEKYFGANEELDLDSELLENLLNMSGLIDVNFKDFLGYSIQTHVDSFDVKMSDLKEQYVLSVMKTVTLTRFNSSGNWYSDNMNSVAA